MNVIKLICTDIDGTLNKRFLCNHNYITKENIESIKKYTNLGKPFVLATGRSLEDAINIADSVEKRVGNPCIPYIIALNGALIYDNAEKKVIDNLVNDQITTNKVLDFVKDLSGSIFVIDASGVMYCKPNFLSKVIAKFYFKSKQIKMLDFDNLPNNIQKIMVFTFRGNSFAIKSKINASILGAYVACSGKCFLEIIDKNINKFYALEKILERLNITLDETCTIGNEGNDILMLESAGFGAAVDFDKSSHLYYNNAKIQFHSKNNSGTAVQQVIVELFRLKYI